MIAYYLVIVTEMLTQSDFASAMTMWWYCEFGLQTMIDLWTVSGLDSGSQWGSAFDWPSVSASWWWFGYLLNIGSSLHFPIQSGLAYVSLTGSAKQLQSTCHSVL